MQFKDNKYQKNSYQPFNNELTSKNDLKKNEKKKKSKIETPINSKNKLLSCQILIESRTPAKLKSHYKGKNPIKSSIKIFNNGKNPIPAESYLISKKDDSNSELYIEKTLINNGQEVQINETIIVDILLYFKDYDNIKNGYNLGKILLFNQKYGQIGEEGIVKIEILDEGKNIVENNEVSRSYKGLQKDGDSIFSNFEKKDSRKMTHQVKPEDFSKMIQGNKIGDSYES